jgi:hypothetical protein
MELVMGPWIGNGHLESRNGILFIAYPIYHHASITILQKRKRQVFLVEQIRASKNYPFAADCMFHGLDIFSKMRI